MELTKKIKKNFFPSKKLAQHFLTEKRILKKIVLAAEINENDSVLEIGTGFGNLTREIAKKAKKVITIEKDPKLLELAKQFLKDFKNIEFVCQDVLSLSLEKFQFSKVMGNLPYYIATTIIKKFLLTKEKPKLMVFLVQKEVAKRIVARAPKTNFLALFVEFFAKSKIVMIVKRKYFWPKPKVDGAVIKIEPYQTLINKEVPFEFFLKTIKAGFSHPRKTLLNNLTFYFKKNKIELEKILLKLGIDSKKRPENLSLSLWIKLTKELFSL